MKYLKCPCQKCGGPIAFPAHGIGTAVLCPHCDQGTILFAKTAAFVGSNVEIDEAASISQSASTEHPSSVRSESLSNSDTLAENIRVGPSALKRRLLWFAPVILVIVGGAAMTLAFRDKLFDSNPDAIPDLGVATSTGSATNAYLNSNKAEATSATALLPKSISDLRTSPIVIEKAKGSSLVYAVGRIQNDSEHQRFGVTVELELSDARGSKVGLAKDYRGVLDPRQEWRFRALVLHPDAVSATVASIREEE